tara:strand:- start:1338 stop:3701 length:2364 start_codon:yes stop_codon:yes gene_type:complete
MAYLKNRRERPSGSESAYFIRGQDDGLILPNELAHEIVNMYSLEEGTLRSAWGPAVYVPQKAPLAREDGSIIIDSGGQPASARSFAYDDPKVFAPFNVCDSSLPLYGKLQHGIHHAVLQGGERDVLLLHTSNELWEFRGWKRDWRQLISNPASAHGLRGELPDDESPSFPTQFETVGNGVVIVPQNGRAYFYDGHIIAPLGFSETPSTPMSSGPESTTSFFRGAASGKTDGINDTGYAHTGLWISKDKNNPSGMEYGFKKSRIGTVNPYLMDGPSDSSTPYAAGLLDAGEWRCKVQYIDVFGNLSPPSEASAPVGCDRQGTATRVRNKFDFISAEAGENVAPENLKFQLAWTGVSTGPDHCVGRNLYRTKDLINSGDAGYYALPQNTSATFTTFATLQDNVTTIYPDNMSDSYLGAKLMDVVPVPRFKLCRAAFGRLFIANTRDNEGLIRFSQPGAWGTFQKGDSIYPDASGGEITGLWRCDRGLLAFTSSSTFLITALNQGSDFSAVPISREVGCAAPNSLQTLPDGRVIWLSYGGFYSFDGNTISFESAPLNRLLKRFTLARFSQACSVFDGMSNEYRCWVSTDGSVENNLCLTYSGDLWRTRTDVQPRDACVTDDHRSYLLAAGSVTGQEGRDGVFLLDHAASRAHSDLRALSDVRESKIETVWMQGFQSKRKETIPTIYLWFRETEIDSVKIEVMRDWREDVVEEVTIDRFTNVDEPSVWGKTRLGESGAKFRRRRPYWTRAQIYLPSAEVVKFRITGTGFWEFVGLSFDASPRTYGNAQLPG